MGTKIVLWLILAGLAYTEVLIGLLTSVHQHKQHDLVLASIQFCKANV